MKLETGKSYRAVVRVDVPRLVVSRSAMQNRFAELGFSSVVAWLDARDVPADWGPKRPAQLDDGWPAFVQGRWDRPSVELERPAAVIDVWTFAPTATSSSSSSATPADDELGDTVWRVAQLLLLKLGTKVAKEAIDEVFG